MQQDVITVTLNPCIDKTIAIEKLVPYGLNRVVNSRSDPGGKGINVARVLKNFGVGVTVTGLIAGSQGTILKGALKQAQITEDFLEISGETRTNLKIFDESVNKTTEINETGFQVSSQMLTEFQKKFDGLLQKTSMVVLSGSLPPGVPKNFYADCISMAKARGVKALLDADGEALAAGMRAIPYAVKPNKHELEALTGRSFKNREEIVKAAMELIRTGIEVVIISLGANGAVVVNSEDAYLVDSWDIKVKSATAAGDSMVASLAYSILNQGSLFDIAKITTAAGTITASKPGTEICTFDEVQQSLEKVTVTKFSAF